MNCRLDFRCNSRLQ